MKKILQYIALMIVLILFQCFLPWWTLVIPCIAGGYLISAKAFRSFMLGFLMVFSVWLFVYLYMNFLNSSSPIARQMSGLLHIPNKYLLFVLASILGGIVGGFSSLLGFYIKSFRGDQRAAAAK